jgi:hypothetical protein
MEKPIEFYHISRDSKILHDLKEFRNLAIKEIEGRRKIQNIIPSQTDSSYNHPLKLHKINIGTTEQPKIAMVVLTGENDRPSTGRVEPVRGCLITQAVWYGPL